MYNTCHGNKLDNNISFFSDRNADVLDTMNIWNENIANKMGSSKINERIVEQINKEL